MRVVIVRPAVIISTLKKPFEGWTDTVSAAGAIAYPLAMGWIDYELFAKDLPFELIPSDLVVNCILITAVYGYQTPKPELNIFQSCSSVANQVTVQQFYKNEETYLKKNPWPVATAEAKIDFTSDKETHTRYHRFKMLKLTAQEKIAELMGNKSLAKNIAKFKKIVQFSYESSVSFERFKTNIFTKESSRTHALWESLTPEEQEIFDCDVRQINWEKMAANFTYGIGKYYLN